MTNQSESVVDELLRERREELEAEHASDHQAERVWNRPTTLNEEEFFARHEQRVAGVLAAQAQRREARKAQAA